MGQGASYFQSTIRPLIIVVSIILSAFIVSVATGMTAIIIPGVMETHGLNGSQIGLMMSLLILAIVPLSLTMPTILRYVGMRSVFIISTLMRVYAIWAFPHYNDVYHWAALLTLYGFGEFAFLFIVQAWMGLVPFKKGAGFIISMLGVSISAGVGVSALVVEAFNLSSIDLYIGMAVITAAAIFPVMVSFLWTPGLEKPSSLTFKECFTRTPLVMVSAMVVGFQGLGIQYLIVLYGTRAGLDITQASFLLAAFTLGPIVFEASLASLSDKFDRRNILMAGTFLSLVCAIYLPLAIYYPLVAYVVLFIWGGIVGGLYSVSFAILRDRYSIEELVPAVGSFTAMFGFGGIIGVISIGTLMDVFGSTDALPSATNIANFIFFCFAANRYIKALSSKEEVA